jgi:hypothetical protein
MKVAADHKQSLGFVPLTNSLPDNFRPELRSPDGALSY